MSLLQILVRLRLEGLSDKDERGREKGDILEPALLKADMRASYDCSYLLLADLRHS